MKVIVRVKTDGDVGAIRNGDGWSFTFHNAIDVSDGYHTFSELYDHRRVLTAALFNVLARELNYIPSRSLLPFKSKLHSDGSMFDGYFIVGLRDQYKNITYLSYHYNLEYWDQFEIEELKSAPEYDGHTSQDVIERLLRL